MVTLLFFVAMCLHSRYFAYTVFFNPQKNLNQGSQWTHPCLLISVFCFAQTLFNTSRLKKAGNTKKRLYLIFNKWL
uniref:Uncharacterized protein n=1 Tax=Anguilla anguilla TaxID=7936 RepID=A0A0E9WYP9_ANGAN